MEYSDKARERVRPHDSETGNQGRSKTQRETGKKASSLVFVNESVLTSLRPGLHRWGTATGTNYLFKENKEKGMAQPKADYKRKTVVGQTLLFGALSAILYLAVFMHSSTVTEYFARGGYYAAFPVLTVFLFSFVHGAFASKLWSALGVEAVVKPTVRPEERPAPRPTRRPDTRPRLRV